MASRVFQHPFHYLPRLSVEPPTAPQISPDPPTIDGTFIVVCWRAVNNSGGRDDLHYNIYTLPAGGSIFSRANAEPIEPSGANQCYELSGLQSQTSYTIVVTSANGATNDPVEFEELSQVENRFIAFYVSTGEGGGEFFVESCTYMYEADSEFFMHHSFLLRCSFTWHPFRP